MQKFPNMLFSTLPFQDYAEDVSYVSCHMGQVIVYKYSDRKNNELQS